jgi:hypothetical protein
MSPCPRRFVSLVRLLPAGLLMLALATPAAAQLGGLKKKVRAAAGVESAAKDGNAGAPAAGARGGTVVVDEKVVDQLIAGLKAGRAERETAQKEDNAYGRYQRDVAAYEAAKAKCDASHNTFTQRMVADEKLRDRYSAMVDKMVKAQEKQDQKLAAVYGDSAMAMIEPSCLVQQPKQPDDYYDAQREIDSRAEQAELKGSGLSRSEMAMAKDRAWGILQGAPADASASEQSAVNSRGAELKRLMGIQEVQPARAEKPAPPPAPAPAPATQPGMSDVQMQRANCMSQNAQKHEKEIEALAQRAQAAQQANDMNKLMAIADSIQRLQNAGCQ